ncbi:pre-rRNA processing and 40S ribosomal subunit assembly [Lecanora helva]
MTPILGRRRRRADLAGDDIDSAGQDDDQERLHTLLQQHFEYTFEPLERVIDGNEIIEKLETPDAAAQSESDSDWDGCSEDDERAVKVVHHSADLSSKSEVSRRDLKNFMVWAFYQTINGTLLIQMSPQTAKPPAADAIETVSSTRKSTEPTNEEKSSETANLKKDLALQRLLKESHLLDSASSLSHAGRNRHKATDLRLRDMGSKSSIFTQQNMPLAQRKGIQAKSAEREELRRRDAQENGIILEKASKLTGKERQVRQRGIGAPSVGKFQRGMLKLSKKDIAEIEGPQKKTRKKR